LAECQVPVAGCRYGRSRGLINCALRSSSASDGLAIVVVWPNGRSQACLYRPNAVELLAALQLSAAINSAIFEMINLWQRHGSQCSE
jgi:hypothetical protein